MTFRPPEDFVPLRTGDGSFTLASTTLGERYHSAHGAVQESTHVFIVSGLKHLAKDRLDILEVGLGTGLNALLTWIEADRSGIRVTYTALEPHPLSEEVVRALDHPGVLGVRERGEGSMAMMTAPDGVSLELSPNFRFQRILSGVGLLEADDAYDLVYFDAFAPKVQPEMWTLDVFQRMFRAIRPGGVLVTYCAKGVVRRTMLAAGFTAERIKGPPGKLQMLRATKPDIQP